jgi:ribonuclease VapC
VIVVDTSALIAILWDEPEAERFVQILLSQVGLISTATRLEAYTVCLRRRGQLNAARMNQLINDLDLQTVAFDQALLDHACEAYARYGRGGDKPALNFGDCFAYALAKARDLPLLFKGEDFSATDVAVAILS